MAAWKKSSFKELTSSLIKHLTDLESGTENFDICAEFVNSNFRFHRYGNPSEKDILKRYNGLIEKFLIKGQDIKANALKICLQKITPLSLESKPDSVYAPLTIYSALLLIISLSDDPLKNTYIPSEVIYPRPITPPLTWARIIEEDPLEGGHWDIPSDFSSSDDEYDLEEMELEVDANGKVIGLDKLMGKKKRRNNRRKKTDHKIAMPDMRPRLEVIDFEGPVDINVANLLAKKQYWQGYTDEKIEDSDINLLFLNLHEPLLLAPTLAAYQSRDPLLSWFDPRTNKYIDEIDVVREVIFMLKGYENLLFSQQEGVFKIVLRATLRHLTEGSFKDLLRGFRTYGNCLQKLRAIIMILTTSSPTRFGQTSQAFASAIGEMMAQFEDQLSILEGQFQKFGSRQSGRDTYVSLLALNERLTDELDMFRTVEKVISKTPLAEAVADLSKSFKPAELTVTLLTTLYNQVILSETAATEATYIKLKTLFERTFRPYWRMIDLWIFEGIAGEHEHDEFLVARFPEVESRSTNYWQDAFKVRPVGSVIGAEDKVEVSSVPAFLLPFLSKILVAGKAVNLLMSLGMVDINLKVYTQTQEIRGKVDRLDAPSNNIPTFKEIHAAVFTEGIKEYPSLSKAHFPLWNIVPKIAVQPSTKPISQENDGKPPLTLYNYSLYETLNLFISPQYEASGQLLNKILTRKCHLRRHFRGLAGFYLMLEGDLMHRFCEKVFEKIDRKKPWYDSQILNSIFMEACRQTEWEDFDNLHIWVRNIEEVRQQKRASFTNRGATSKYGRFLNVKSVRIFENIIVEYRLPWPVNNIIRPLTIQQYKKIISLLLEIKRAKHLLERLQLSVFKYRAKRVEQDPAMILFYSLRVRMMWFVNALYNYVMTTILHSETHKFHKKLDEIFDIDQVIRLHDDYVRRIRDRCLLNEKASSIMKSITEILDLTLRFWNLFLKHVMEPLASMTERSIIIYRKSEWSDEESDEEDDEEDDSPPEDADFMEGLKAVDREFRRTSEFIVTSLEGVARSGGFTWFEALASALAA